jgi:Flp pilus assembly pilin Flp
MTDRAARRAIPTTLGSARLHRILQRLIHPFRGSARGATIVEYVVVLGFVSLFAILAFNRFGRTLHLAYQAEARHIQGEGIPGAYSILDDLGGLTDPDDLCDIVTGICRPCSGTCFGAGTLVATKDGNRPIEEIKPGELVWSTNEKTGEKALRPVLTTFVNYDAEVLDLELLRGPAVTERIEVTPAHRFWVANQGWARADQLAAAALWSTTESVVATASRVKGQKTVYNLEVEEFHTYHVGASGVLVHNQNTTPCPRNPGDDGGTDGPEPDDGELDCGEVGAYNQLPSSPTQQRDHVPSGGALRKRTEMLLLDTPLTSRQERAMRDASPAFRRLLNRVENEGLTIAIPNDIHRRNSETYGGRNTHRRQVADANDLAAAARSNIAAVQAALAGSDCADDYAAAAEEILNMTQADYDRRLQNAIDALTPEEREEIAEAFDEIT